LFGLASKNLRCIEYFTNGRSHLVLIELNPPEKHKTHLPAISGGGFHCNSARLISSFRGSPHQNAPVYNTHNTRR
jgi:hypothetical protein